VSASSPSAGADRITYVGHATVLIELAGVRVLTDPVLRSRLLGVIRRHAEPPAKEVAAGIDAVLISHLHPDHLDPPSLRRLGRDVRVIVPARARGTLRRRGFRDVIELAVGESARVGEVVVAAVPAIHDGRRYKFGRRVDSLGYILEGGGRRIYFAGDTELFEGMSELAGGLDVALLPIAGWGPKVGGPGHLDARTAAEAAAILRPRVAIPIHWGTLLGRGLEGRRVQLLRDPPREFVAQLAELAPDVEAGVLVPGESLTLG
jgi:L-ascorbate metabolism protein UlaG (beta-lactamase superfamily)